MSGIKIMESSEPKTSVSREVVNSELSSTTNGIEINTVEELANINNTENTANTFTAQNLPSLKQGTVEQKTAFYGNQSDASKILDEKSDRNYSLNIQEISKN